MKNIYQLLDEARKIIRTSKVEKDGRNEYSKYDYFTPEKVETLVADACEKTGTICITSLKADAFGLYQVLEFVEIADPANRLSFELRTAEADMTATNRAQKMGGTDTYSERYIKQKTFQIKDNDLDFDAHDNRPTSMSSSPSSSRTVHMATSGTASTPAARPPLGRAKAPFDATEYRLKLESTGSTEELGKVWKSLPAAAQTALASLKDELKAKYTKAGI